VKIAANVLATFPQISESSKLENWGGVSLQTVKMAGTVSNFSRIDKSAAVALCDLYEEDFEGSAIASAIRMVTGNGERGMGDLKGLKA
jgi:hypothetical protein